MRVVNRVVWVAWVLFVCLMAGCIGEDVAGIPTIRQDPDLGLRLVGEQIRFSVDPDHVPSEPVWAFGDGGTARGVEVAHTYEMAGRYLVTMAAGDVVSTTVIAVSRQLLVDLDAPRSTEFAASSPAIVPLMVAQNATAIVYNLTLSDPLPMHRLMVELRGPSGEVIDEFSPWGEKHMAAKDYDLEVGTYNLAFWTEGPVEEIHVRGWLAVNYWPREHALNP